MVKGEEKILCVFSFLDLRVAQNRDFWMESRIALQRSGTAP